MVRLLVCLGLRGKSRIAKAKIACSVIIHPAEGTKEQNANAQTLELPHQRMCPLTDFLWA